MTKREEQAEATETVLWATRAFVAIAARSLADDVDLTIPQFRALVLVKMRGPQNVKALAEALDVNPSTVTRMCDQLESFGLVTREPSADDRREVRIVLTPAATRRINTVWAKRRTAVQTILDDMPKEAVSQLVAALDAFCAAAGEPPDEGWSLG